MQKSRKSFLLLLFPFSVFFLLLKIDSILIQSNMIIVFPTSIPSRFHYSPSTQIHYHSVSQSRKQAYKSQLINIRGNNQTLQHKIGKRKTIICIQRNLNQQQKQVTAPYTIVKDPCIVNARSSIKIFLIITIYIHWTLFRATQTLYLLHSQCECVCALLS